MTTENVQTLLCVKKKGVGESMEEREGLSILVDLKTNQAVNVHT